ncbi:ADP-ribose pyrophosphatase YjhB, NUDIX family [Reichenbachiella faecimaris]|uniref:ADP-ribose pyrophosphatase YjhB, NUDIX family n=1 Tax=Reichenbachiella faecimaris TaxID=692418 RepID=A0A1W2G8A4_REIFA|nr:NUDIX domain-containing protein [Reichenbachiella faecimaris]SMD32915.1 ADP-ribose pyrophosphatase YjhB, NUDIX family [Reichenbachiella faecimaris]
MTDESTSTYIVAQPILVAVDNVIFGFDGEEEKLKVLLFKRKVEPFAGQWSLVGSFVQPNESAVVAASRILTEFTGLESVFLEQLHCYSSVDRDPGDRVISIAYYSLIQLETYRKKLVEEHEAAWFELHEIPDLVIDHKQMVADALVKLQDNARRRPVGFNLLPPKFTLPQLFKLYQEIYQKEIDDRNFRKKILATDLLEKLDTKDKTTSKKGAFHYQFNKTKYQQLETDGYDILFH